MRKFMRTRAREPAAAPLAAGAGAVHKHNGYANGTAGAVASRREDHSTLSSRQWTGSEWSGAGAGAGAGEEEEGGAPWEDPEFPCSWRAIGSRRAAAGVVWMRPHELWARPTFLDYEEDPDSERFAQRWRLRLGALGDAHVSAAAAALALTPRLLARAAPPQPPHPARRYRFAFWVWGEWRAVEVDDRLPCRAGATLGARGGRDGDCALPLLEKAYAKLYGSYRALRSGSCARALQDLTGGAVQALLPASAPRPQLARALLCAVPRATLLVASATRATPGLQPRRPYAVTGLARVRGETELLVRVRAVCAPPPPGAPAPPPDAELLSAATAPSDFWMSLGEFRAAFGRLALVHMPPDAAPRGERPWRCALARRHWRPGASAGGPPGARTAHANPAFRLSVPRAARVLVALAQRYSPRGGGEGLHAVGFALYALKRGGARLVAAASPVRVREVCALYALPPGCYRVVPHTRRAHTAAAFLLRILSDDRADVWEENEDNTVLRGISAELEEAQLAMPEEMRAALARRMGELDPDEEVDAARARVLLARGGARCSAALCTALVALRDAALTGRVRVRELPALLALLGRWRAAYETAGDACSYGTRALLGACGVRVSNKVLEGVVARFARARRLPRAGFLLALTTLHLAHERSRCLDAKLKSNPLSLEEMILMTIYS